MKEIDPTFNLWVLEEDAMGIFLNAYNHFLKGDLTTLESLCSDTALGYFRVLLKKQEAEVIIYILMNRKVNLNIKNSGK